MQYTKHENQRRHIILCVNTNPQVREPLNSELKHKRYELTKFLELFLYSKFSFRNKI
jgi:iron only hydrogenase large subunit-like protein